ncbi:MAG: hypothetical protein JWO20_903 [Candidatus Angelobacter sp.]|nr:hypothetical protein [Candidatus Angelobacter sp.]
MRTLIPAVVVIGLFIGSASAKDCTVSNKFQLKQPQVLASVLEDPIPAALPGFELELLSGKKVVARSTTSYDGKYSFGEVAAGRYQIHIRHGGDPFCAPAVKCDEAGCSVQRQLKLNPKNKPETVYVERNAL